MTASGQSLVDPSSTAVGANSAGWRIYCCFTIASQNGRNSRCQRCIQSDEEPNLPTGTICIHSAAESWTVPSRRPRSLLAQRARQRLPYLVTIRCRVLAKIYCLNAWVAFGLTFDRRAGILSSLRSHAIFSKPIASNSFSGRTAGRFFYLPQSECVLELAVQGDAAFHGSIANDSVARSALTGKVTAHECRTSERYFGARQRLGR